MQKTVLITGASSGFGRETAKLFSLKGWNVIATMRSPEKETELTHLQNVSLIQLDVTDKDSISKAVAASEKKFGTIDVLVNNAGYGTTGAFESVSKEEIMKQFDVNLFGVMSVTQAVLPLMRKKKSGIIINVSSFGGVTASPFGTLYASSKFALEGFSESLSHELDFLNIKVAIIEPGSVATNFRNSMAMTPTDIQEYQERVKEIMPSFIGRTAKIPKATPEQVAETIYTAATDNKKKLRYVIGKDAEYYVNLKQLPEEELLKIMRS